ncbi:uncharacterized protein LACBIDRAFT_328724 [Laccaria bicolor S238N-H82]|uniref:Predicted protein n=1 Tax=Laccaria bicolor (strain S238N-H82 / ATCC MYA-4686) TaxID=486041 RepID=B0DFT2_LACBS|nr:uncharacterized protein LACBIDRAFT_328724 [Laccaria bicolor S238N-H82]EDR06517.1 predicted protein [Laccaria bicolor S238N-H82]|eukprot:XP_001882889.1 predicted protein [Laccaria bicolor S238N-H82]
MYLWGANFSVPYPSSYAIGFVIGITAAYGCKTNKKYNNGMWVVQGAQLLLLPNLTLIFVNMNPQTIEKSLGIKSTTKKKESIIDIDDKDEGAEQAHIEKNKKKKRPSIPVAFCFTSLVYSTTIEYSDSEARSVGKAGKSKKKKVIASDDSGDEIPPVDLTIFVYVEKPNPPHTAKGNVEESDRYAHKGPFKLSSNDSYGTFLHKVSTALPCPILHIIEEKMSWKPQTPQNAKPLPMGAATGYSTMIDALKVKRVGARVGIVIMPPLKKPDEDMANMSHICSLSALMLFIQFWDADGSGKAIKKGFDCSELEFRSTGDSIVQQKERFDKTITPILSELKTKYPVGNQLLFSDQRVYKDSATGWFYDLTEACLNIWASHIARNAATLDTLPQSTHFNHNTRIRPKKTTNQSDMSIALAAPENTALPAAVSTPPAAPPATTTSSLVELMMLQMLQQQQQNLMKAPAPTIPATVTPLSDASTSLNTAFYDIPTVPLVDFCTWYRIDEKDKAHLKKLEFQPGDSIDLLGSDEWKENAGFTQLSWARMKAKNQQFLQDVQMGKWIRYET